MQEVWNATQEQVAVNNELLKELSAKAGLPTDAHAAGDCMVQRMQMIMD